MTRIRPPRVAARILGLLVPEDEREFLLGDLEEQYEQRFEVNKRNARIWYYGQVLRSGGHVIRARVRVSEDTTVGPHRQRTTNVPDFLRSVVSDIRFAFRTLRRRPMYAAVTVATLGLGIGAASAMFSVVDAVLIKGLPYRDQGRLVTVWQVVPRWQEVVNLSDYWDRGWISFGQYRAWMDADDPILDLAIHDDDGLTLTGIDQPERLAVGRASASLLRVLGVNPLLGRWFLPDEEGTEAGQSRPVVVLSHELWQRKFGGDPDVIGSTLISSDRSHTIVGILPPGFKLRLLGADGDNGKRDVWVPLDPNGNHGFWEAIGRLAPGASLEHAETVASSVLLPDDAASRKSVRLVPRKESEILGLTSPLMLLWGATALLLCLACTNMLTLALGEMLGRRSEIATRTALGASGGRIFRQLITESVVLGIASSIVGTVIAVVGTRALVLLAPPIPRIDEIVVDLRVLSFAVALGAVAGLLFGTVPPIVAARNSPSNSSRGSGQTRTKSGQRFTQGLVAAEITLTVVLLVAGGLLTQSLMRLLAVDAGFDSEKLVGVHVLPPGGEHEPPAGEMEFYDDVLERIRATPGVVGASMANGVPFIDGTTSFPVRIDDQNGSSASSLSALGYGIATGYFEVMGMQLYAGRSFSKYDGAQTLQTAVINASMAQRCWPAQSPIGAQFEYAGRTVTVIGVVGDVRHEALGRDPVSTFYVPFTQLPWYGEANFIVRTDGNANRIIPLLRSAVWSVNRDVPITKSATVESYMSQSAIIERYRTLLIAAFGICATVLAAVGIFGVTARSIAQKTKEMGIRMALGAKGSGLVRATVRGSLNNVLPGVATGLLGALWVSRLLSRFLFGVEHSDPLTYGVVAASVVVVCLLASYIPARRIARVDPVRVLKAE